MLILRLLLPNSVIKILTIVFKAQGLHFKPIKDFLIYIPSLFSKPIVSYNLVYPESH